MQFRVCPVTFVAPPLIGKKLSDLLEAAAQNLNITPLPTACQVLRIRANATNAANSRITVGGKAEFYHSVLLPGKEEVFIDYSGRNGISTMDKYILMVDSSGVPITGAFTVAIETA